MEVIVGIGVPGCGKTTYLKPLAAKLEYTYINGDDIREELTGDPTNHSQEKQVWETAHKRIKESLRTTGVVVDATYSKVKDRKKLIQFCRESNAKHITACWFDPPLEVCLARNEGRSRSVPKEVIVKMHKSLSITPPSTAEGFNVVLRLTE